ncbi:hypothetical protein GOP47_0009522 [Adiantum capillus-veneris]|uniref:Protein kinase domain-containing protein n=1 Tax=Adiantum capillus-veneris TaxID=13818 RepID=A0A9D4ZJK8_ADICA|nr:hypothetical protein GOP47_0009522 [Adiantum capillus-veneris]
MGLGAWMCGLIGAGAVVATAGFILLIFQLIFLLHKRMCTPILPCTWTKAVEPPNDKDYHTSADFGKSFTFKEIEECCEGFSNLIGETRLYHVYKGILHDGTEVAVKRAKKCAEIQIEIERNFHFQVELLSRIHHQYLANLIGFCEEKQQRLLVFQYAPNGSLFNNLHGDDECLSWKQRMGVAVGTASALAYLHQSCGYTIVHGDLTSHNVLLADDFSAKVCGIGMQVQSTLVNTPKGQVASGDSVDFKGRGMKSLSDDVYSFGVLLLELISGKSAFSENPGKIVEWASQFLQSREQMTILADAALKNVVPVELYSVCEIARLCIQTEAASRPGMEEVLFMLVQSLGIGLEQGAAPLNDAVA